MPASKWWARAREVPGAPGARRLAVAREEWTQAAQDVAAAGGRLVSLWAARDADTPSGAAIHAAYWIDAGLLLAELAMAARDGEARYPGLETLFPAASRMQRAASELYGVLSSDPDRRPWLHHGREGYDFVRVEGEGVHEIAVGPVHAGTIEPGHFRFSVVGEKVLRLEERLGYVHKGIERRFTEVPILAGHRLAARVSGDSAVAFSWAYCQALEGMAACPVPHRALWLRALCLELERLANHLGDLGALGNDAGFGFALTQFSRVKEELLREIERAFGQRYLSRPWYTLLETHGSVTEGASAERIAAALEEAHDAGSIEDAAVASNLAQARAFWQLREEISDAQAREGKCIKHDISVPITRVPAFITETSAALAAAHPEVRPIIFGHLGDGNLHFNVSLPAAIDGTAFSRLQADINRLVHDLVVRYAGSICAEHGLGVLRRSEALRYKSAVEIALTRAIKQALDPAGLLNPGKGLA